MARRKETKGTRLAHNKDSGTQVTHNVLQELTNNVLPGNCRFDTLEDKQYIVVPMVILTEGVHNGSEGPVYYPQSELQKTPAVWNYKPIVVYHPEMNGNPMSACDQTIINNRKVGVMMNTRFENGRLKSEAWIDKEKANRVDNRIMSAVENNKMMELSTGVFIDVDKSPGDRNGEQYAGIARNYRPDHLALLPDKLGACSIADGAGFLRNQQNGGDLSDKVLNNAFAHFQRHLQRIGVVENEMSHDNIRSELRRQLRERLAPNATTVDEAPMVFIEDVYSNFFIYEWDNKLYRLGYSTSDTGVSLSTEEPVEVVRVTEYRTVDGTFVGNNEPNTNKSMSKTELIDKLMQNQGWSKDDRPKLEALSEEQLKLMEGGIAPVQDPNKSTQQTGDGDSGDSGKQQTTNKTQGKAKQQNKQPAANAKTGQEDPSEEGGTQNAGNGKQQASGSVEDFIKSAPPQMREVLNNSLALYQEEKDNLVQTILQNENNEFSQEELEGRPLGELKRIARLAGVKQQTSQQRAPNYGGQAPVPNQGGTQNADVEEALEIPSLNFESATAK